MNKRFLGVLGFAFVVASVASLLLYRVLVNRPAQAKSAQSSVQILLANRDIDIGNIIKEDDVRLSDWPGVAPVGAETKLQDVVGRGVMTTIFAKEPVIESRLAPKGAGGGLAAMIPPGMRAFAVRVNEVIGVSGFVVAGMHVDVLISGNRPGNNATIGTMTKTLMQNIEVLSAGQDFKKDAEGKPIMTQVINLCVTPEQAEQLSLASNQTVIQLVLRNPMDREVAKTTGTAMEYLFTGVKPKTVETAAAAPRPRPAPAPAPVVAPAPPPKKETFVMEIVQGSKKTETKFESSGEGK